MARLPDFVLIGAMKAGTTTLFRRLASVPGITLPDTKEPHFFSSEQTWSRGLDWYCSLFDGCDGITGEASASYSDAATSGLVSERIRGGHPKQSDCFMQFAIRQNVFAPTIDTRCCGRAKCDPSLLPLATLPLSM